jgi:pimeloyl-ACP methyl ester carboxylesterase
MTNGVMTGVVEDSGKKRPFRMDLAAKIDLSRYTGNYQVAPGRFITVAPSYPPGWLVAGNFQSGQGGMLLPRSETAFVCGSGLKLYPVQAAIHFTTNQLGQVTALDWKPKDGPAVTGTRIKALEQEDVSFTNGDVTLAGRLVLPPTKGPHPVMVVVFGSGPWVRSDAEGFANFFALNGVAALIYDKRGCGSSTGDPDPYKGGFDDFAGDALAGVELLKNRPDINPHQIGLWGGSEGGWVVSLAASRCADVAFLIDASTPGTTPEATSALQVEHWMKTAGYSKADVDEARSLYLLSSRYARTGSNGSEAEAARKADQNKLWYSNGILRSYFGFNESWKLTGNYDPVPALHKVHCPVLAMFGEADPLVPARQSAEIWKTALREAGNHDVITKIFPHANHTMADPRTDAQVPGFYALQRNWLLKHLTINDEPTVQAARTEARNLVSR